MYQEHKLKKRAVLSGKEKQPTPWLSRPGGRPCLEGGGRLKRGFSRGLLLEAGRRPLDPLGLISAAFSQAKG